MTITLENTELDQTTTAAEYDGEPTDLDIDIAWSRYCGHLI